MNSKGDQLYVTTEQGLVMLTDFNNSGSVIKNSFYQLPVTSGFTNLILTENDQYAILPDGLSKCLVKCLVPQ